MSIVAPTGIDVPRFRTLLAQRLGLSFDDSQLGFLRHVLATRLESLRMTGDAYFQVVEGNASVEEIGAVARAVTVGETYFFRNIDQFHAFRDVALPDRMRARGAIRRLRVLSAGCASGEEPYTLAIIWKESVADPRWAIDITAVDVNPGPLARATRAHFSAWALRETPLETQRRWFNPGGSEVVLDASVRALVRFHAGNLMDSDLDVYQPNTWDVVFCRNVMMYFTPANAHALVARLERAIAPDGYLFLGHAETLRGLSSSLELRHTHGTFYYQRRPEGEQLEPPPLSLGVSSEPRVVEPLAPLAGDDSWVETIRKASERVRALADASAESRVEPHAAVASRWDLAPLLDLLRRELFDEALDHLRRAPPESADDPDLLLMSAVLLAHRAQLARAEEVCGRLLEIDACNAGAHYVLALCREGATDRCGAVEHDRVAAHLDPGFAMPRFHLGLLARRAGDRETAKHELGHALGLLQRDDASRVLLFGGGFSRSALIALCRAELVASGGQP